MKKVLSLVMGVAALAVASTASAGATKGYWATGGMFGSFAMNGLIPPITADEVRDFTIPVSMWIIEHDKGLVVFDTGNNIEVVNNCKNYWAPGL